MHINAAQGEENERERNFGKFFAQEFIVYYHFEQAFE